MLGCLKSGRNGKGCDDHRRRCHEYEGLRQHLAGDSLRRGGRARGHGRGHPRPRAVHGRLRGVHPGRIRVHHAGFRRRAPRSGRRGAACAYRVRRGGGGREARGAEGTAALGGAGLGRAGRARVLLRGALHGTGHRRPHEPARRRCRRVGAQPPDRPHSGTLRRARRALYVLHHRGRYRRHYPVFGHTPRHRRRGIAARIAEGGGRGTRRLWRTLG